MRGSPEDERRVGAMVFIMIVVAVLAALATAAVLAEWRRMDAKMVMCIARAQRKYIEEHALRPTDAELHARAMAEVEEMRKKGELP